MAYQDIGQERSTKFDIDPIQLSPDRSIHPAKVMCSSVLWMVIILNNLQIRTTNNSHKQAVTY